MYDKTCNIVAAKGLAESFRAGAFGVKSSRIREYSSQITPLLIILSVAALIGCGSPRPTIRQGQNNEDAGFMPSIVLGDGGDMADVNRKGLRAGQVGASDKSSSFYPIWKLLNHEQKEHFVAGYMRGWQDASRVTEIAIAYVREHPENAVEGLERLQSLYDMSEVRPGQIVQDLDLFYSDPANHKAALSLAMSQAKRAR